MSTQTKKSPDNTHKLNRRAICLRAPLALIILLTVFLAPQRSASTQALSQNPAAQDTPTQTEMINGHKAVAGQVIVRFNDADGPQLETFVKNAIEMVNASGNRNIAPDLNMYHISSNSMNTQALLNMMSKLPGVMYAVPNYIVETQLTPNDTRFGEMWGLNNTGQVVGGQTGIAGADISAVQAWDVSTGSNSIVVGVIDTGVDYNHPDLAANIWSAPSSFTVTVGGQTITCPAGSHGFNAVANTCNPLDDNNHGSHVSGTIGARGNNSSGVAGVNWTTSIMGLKFLSASGSGNTADAIECIQFAIQAKQIFGSAANVRIPPPATTTATTTPPLSSRPTTTRRTCCRSRRPTTATRNPPSPTSAPRPWTSERPGPPSSRLCAMEASPSSAEPRWPPRTSQARRRWCSPDVR